VKRVGNRKKRSTKRNRTMSQYCLPDVEFKARNSHNAWGLKSKGFHVTIWYILKMHIYNSKGGIVATYTQSDHTKCIHTRMCRTLIEFAGFSPFPPFPLSPASVVLSLESFPFPFPPLGAIGIGCGLVVC